MTDHWDEVEDWNEVVPRRPVWRSAPGYDAPLHGWSFRVDLPLPEDRAEAQRRRDVELAAKRETDREMEDARWRARYVVLAVPDCPDCPVRWDELWA